MKKILYVLALGCVLMGCRSKLDLGNMDTKTQVQMGMALPVGSIHMSLKDILGDVEGLYIDSVNNKGVFTWKKDTVISRDYHPMDLARYLSTAKKDMNIHTALVDALKEACSKYGVDPSVIPTSGSFKPAMFGLGDITVPAEFDLKLALDGINEDKTYHERLDRAEIDSASFVTRIKPNGFNFEWDWVDSVILDLGDRFTCRNEAGVYDKKAKRQILYKRPESGPILSLDSIPVTIYDFALDMMINPKPATPYAYYNNVYDYCDFKVKLQFTIPSNTTISLNNDSKVTYILGVRFLDFSAIWGFFDPSSDMYDESVINLDKSLGKLDFLNNAKVPFYNPQIDVSIVTEIAGALFVDDAYVFVTRNDDPTRRIFAEFGNSMKPEDADNPNEKRNQKHDFPFTDNEYLDPDPNISPIGTKTDLRIQLNRSPYGGRIHELFKRMPRELGYQFAIKFNEGLTPQFRITPNTFIDVYSSCKVPFILSDTVFVNYKDTAYDISLSKLSLDSLEKESSVIDTLNATNLKLVMIAKNTIPLHVKLKIYCYDKNDQLIKDPNDSTKYFQLFDQETIMLEPPTFIKASNSQIVPTGEGKTTIISNLDKKELNTLQKIKKIIYDITLDDESLQYAYKMGLDNVRLSENEGVTLKIGVAANVDAVLNFEKNNK